MYQNTCIKHAYMLIYARQNTCIMNVEYMYTHVHMNQYTCMDTHTHTYMNTYTYIDMNTWIQNCGDSAAKGSTHTRTYVQIYIHGHTHTHTYEYIYIYGYEYMDTEFWSHGS